VRYVKGIIIVIALAFAGEAWGLSCSATTSPVNFGGYDTSLSSPLDGAGSLTVTCDTVLTYTATFTSGLYSGGAFNPRKMQISAGADTVNYNLYRDSGRTQIWGDGTGSTFSVSGTSVISSGVVSTIYGRIPAHQNARVGAYGDSITVTVLY